MEKFKGEDPILSKQDVKFIRLEIDAVIKKTALLKSKFGETHKQSVNFNNAYNQQMINLKQAKMWGGQMLEEMGFKLPDEFRDES